MKIATIVGVVYGLFLAAAGVVGYVMAGSLASLIWGVVYGGLVIAAAVAMQRGWAGGWYVTLTLAVGLTLYLGGRALASGFMPSGLMAVVSAAAAAALAMTRPSGDRAVRRP
jgi:uncharacterized membrane protein (UPF0136 family)